MLLRRVGITLVLLLAAASNTPVRERSVRQLRSVNNQLQLYRVSKTERRESDSDEHLLRLLASVQGCRQSVRSRLRPHRQTLMLSPARDFHTSLPLRDIPPELQD